MSASASPNQRSVYRLIRCGCAGELGRALPAGSRETKRGEYHPARLDFVDIPIVRAREPYPIIPSPAFNSSEAAMAATIISSLFYQVVEPWL